MRSERIRRQLEAVSAEVETFGFAGFFGLPVEYVPCGESSGTSQVPVSLKPQFQLHEGLRSDEPRVAAATMRRRRVVRRVRKTRKVLQATDQLLYVRRNLRVAHGFKLRVYLRPESTAGRLSLCGSLEFIARSWVRHFVD